MVVAIRDNADGANDLDEAHVVPIGSRQWGGGGIPWRVTVDTPPRPVAVILEVSDLDRAVRLYRDAFGIDLHPAEHDNDDRWIGGRHAAQSWSDGAFFHFALYAARSATVTTGAQVGFRVTDLDEAHKCAVAAVAKVIHGPRPEPWGRSARYWDNDGNVVELTQPGES